MSAESYVFEKLTEATPVTDIVDQDIYHIVADPETEPPYVQYRRTATDPIVSLEGENLFDRCEIRVEFFAQDFEELQELSDAIREALDVYPSNLTNSGHDKDRLAAWHQYRVINDGVV